MKTNMREKYSTHQGSLKWLPNIFVFAAFWAACFLVSIFIFSGQVLAIDATWSENSLRYNNRTYRSVGTASANDPRQFEQGSQLYAYIENAGSDNQRVHYLALPPGVNQSDATSARAVSFDNNPPGNYTNPSNEQTINISRPDASQPEQSNQNTDNEPRTSCDGRFTFGIGWIVCPITNFLANSMDWLFEQLSSFLAVRPVTTSRDSALYRMWEIMRNFSNVAFVIAFLIVIYSQITSVGYSNYNLKKILPRLVVAAILVNVSYWICALAVDISNLLGYGIHDLFMSIRNSVVGAEGNSWNVVSWKSMAEFILSGGAAVAGAGVLAHVVAASAGGSIAMLLPILVGVILAVLVAILIMAARQALITILIIISPLAFVAYILPNTEKYFDRWRSTFMTMLLLFPIFSVIFGGAQVAGIAIIQNADSINLILLGMAVQVAPVVITPMLIKFSGSLLGRLANIVNNPNRGLVDRTRNWSRDRSEEYRARKIASGRGMVAGYARRNDFKRRRREGWKSHNESRVSQRFDDTSAGRRLAMASRDNEEDKKVTAAEIDRSFSRRVLNDPYAIRRDMHRRLMNDKASRNQDLSDTMYSEAKTGNYTYRTGRTPEMDTAVSDIQKTARDTAINSIRKGMADRRFTSDQAEILKADTPDGDALRLYASGILGEEGKLSVLAQAKAEASKAMINDIKVIEDTLDYDISSDTDKVMARFKSATTMSERIAYMNILSKRGAPGQEKIVEAVKHIDSLRASNKISAGDLDDFKELTAMNQGIMSSAKDLEFWLTNQKKAGDLRSFEEISKDPSTWSNLSISALSSMNIVAQFRALDNLKAHNPKAYDAYITMAKDDPARSNIKLAVRQKHGI